MLLWTFAPLLLLLLLLLCSLLPGWTLTLSVQSKTSHYTQHNITFFNIMYLQIITYSLAPGVSFDFLQRLNQLKHPIVLDLVVYTHSALGPHACIPPARSLTGVFLLIHTACVCINTYIATNCLVIIHMYRSRTHNL